MTVDVVPGPTPSAGTSTSPTISTIWRDARGPLVIAALLLVIALATVLLGGRAPAGTLDPDSVSHSGSHALATLLRDRDVQVTKVRTVDQALVRADRNTTVLVTMPTILPADQLEQLVQSASDIVVISPDDDVLEAMHLPLQVDTIGGVHTRQPDCNLPAVRVAGAVDSGGFRYRVADSSAEQCYRTGGEPTLVSLQDRGRRVTVLGTGAPWTNDRLDREGNAALGLTVLGEHPRLQWLVPDLSAVAATPGERKSVVDLLPDWVLWGAAQVVVAVALIALWRARRLGPVVAEPLPVVVRAAETVEGRATLYRSAHARGRAADALREGCRRRLVGALGLPADADRAAVTTAVAARTGRPAAAVDALLYGSALDDDGALVRLADELDALDREVREP